MLPTIVGLRSRGVCHGGCVGVYARAATVGEDDVGDGRWRPAVKTCGSAAQCSGGGDAVRWRRGWWLPITGCAPSRSD